MALSRKLARLGLVVVSSAFFTIPAGAGLAKWDQTSVTEIAQQLAKACDAWWVTLGQQGGEQIGTGDAQEQFSLAQKAQVLQEQSAALAGNLAKGKGYEETRRMYDGLKEIVDDTEMLAKRAELDQPTQDAWAKVADAMRQIAPYYDPKAGQE